VIAMLGRKTFTQDERDSARADADRQLAAYRAMAAAANGSEQALNALEPVYFNTALLALDRRFVHRVRLVAGKDGTPVNEVELLTDALMNNDGVFRGNTVIKYKPAESVLGLEEGDAIALRADQFAQLADAFLAEIDQKFGE
jgi:hypothetical protein